MKLTRLILGIGIFIICLISLVIAETNEQPVLPKIAVLDFEAIGSGVDREFGKGVAEILLSALAKTEKYQVIERQQLTKVIKELKFQMTDLVDPKSVSEIGKILGAETIVTGSIVKMGKTYTITPRFIEVKTATVKKSENLTCSSEDDIPQMCNQIVNILIGKTKKVDMIQVPNKEKPATEETTWSPNFKEESVEAVAAKFGKQFDKKVIIASSIKGKKINLALTKAMFDEVLKAITQPQGWKYIEEGDCITILTQKELQDEVSASSDGRFKVTKAGIILDTRTDLMWATDPGGDKTWYQARDYADNLRLGGYSDWRLPTRSELKGLYEPSKEHKPYGYEDWGSTVKIDLVFKFSGYWAWSSESHETYDAYHFLLWFTDANTGLAVKRDDSREKRVLAVRYRR